MRVRRDLILVAATVSLAGAAVVGVLTSEKAPASSPGQKQALTTVTAVHADTEATHDPLLNKESINMSSKMTSDGYRATVLLNDGQVLTGGVTRDGTKTVQVTDDTSTQEVVSGVDGVWGSDALAESRTWAPLTTDPTDVWWRWANIPSILNAISDVTPLNGGNDTDGWVYQAPASSLPGLQAGVGDVLVRLQLNRSGIARMTVVSGTSLVAVVTVDGFDEPKIPTVTH